MPLSILLADDHAVVRAGVKRLLEAEEDFRVVGETGDGLEVVDLVDRLRPKVLVLDIAMPGLGGVDVARQVRKRFPATQVVILSMYTDEPYVLESLRGGASAYVVKSARPDELLDAVRAVAAGRRFLSSEVGEHAVEAYAAKALDAPTDALETLTNRERQVLHLLAEGHTHADIADRLGISHRTVETHRANFAAKLGLRSSTEIVRYAIRRGIVEA